MIQFTHIKENYVKIPNELLNDKDLSWKAKGLFCYMASKPDNFNFTVQSLATQFNTGRATLFSAMDELKIKGWLTWDKRSDGKGKYQLTTTLLPKAEKQTVEETPMYQPKSEIQTEGIEPKSEIQTEGIEPKSDYRELGYPTVGKPDCISNTDFNNNKDIYKNDKSQQIKNNKEHKQAIVLPSSARMNFDQLLNHIATGEK